MERQDKVELIAGIIDSMSESDKVAYLMNYFLNHCDNDFIAHCAGFKDDKTFIKQKETE